MWPPQVQRLFDIAKNDGNLTLENVLHGPYNKLLYTLFPANTDFTVTPNFEVDSNMGADYFATYEIFLENRPVLVLALNRERDLVLKSERKTADNQI